MLTKIFLFTIECYQKLLSPYLGNTCRFYPSCSHYSKQSIEKHGLAKGLSYTVIRLMKCHPFHPGGHDPVK